MIRVRRLIPWAALVAILGAAAGIWLARDLPRRKVEQGLARKLGAEVRLGGFSIQGTRRFLLRDLEVRHMTGQPRLDLFEAGTVVATGSASDMLEGRFEELRLSGVEARLVPPPPGPPSAAAEAAVELAVVRLDIEGARVVLAGGGAEARFDVEASLRGVGGDLEGSVRIRAEAIPIGPLLALASGERAASIGGSIEGFAAGVTLSHGGSQGGVEARAKRATIRIGDRSLEIPDPAIDATLERKDRVGTIRVDARAKLPYAEEAVLSAEIDPSTGDLVDGLGSVRSLKLDPLLAFTASLPAAIQSADATADLDVEVKERNLLDYRLALTVPRLEIHRGGTSAVGRGSTLDAEGTLDLRGPSPVALGRSWFEVPELSGSAGGVRLPAGLSPLRGTLELGVSLNGATASGSPAGGTLRVEGGAALDTPFAGRLEVRGTVLLPPSGDRPATASGGAGDSATMAAGTSAAASKVADDGPATATNPGSARSQEHSSDGDSSGGLPAERVIGEASQAMNVANYHADSGLDLSWSWKGASLEQLAALAKTMGLAGFDLAPIKGQAQASGTLEGPVGSPRAEGAITVTGIEVGAGDRRARSSPSVAPAVAGPTTRGDAAPADRASIPSLRNGSMEARFAWSGSGGAVELSSIELRGDAVLPPLEPVPLVLSASGRADLATSELRIDRALLDGRDLGRARVEGRADLRALAAMAAEAGRAAPSSSEAAPSAAASAAPSAVAPVLVAPAAAPAALSAIAPPLVAPAAAPAALSAIAPALVAPAAAPAALSAIAPPLVAPAAAFAAPFAIAPAPVAPATAPPPSSAIAPVPLAPAAAAADGGANGDATARATATVSVEGVDLARWQKLLEPLIGEAANGYAVKGEAEARLAATLGPGGRWSASGTAKVAKGGLASEDGSRVLEGADTAWDLRLGGTAGEPLTVDAKAAVGGFQLLWGAFFADGAALSSGLEVQGTVTEVAGDAREQGGDAPAAGGAPAEWAMSGRAVWDFPTGPRLEAAVDSTPGAPVDYALRLDVKDLGTTVARYVRAPLGDAVPLLGRIEAGGSLRAEARGAISLKTFTIRGRVAAENVRLAGTEGFAEVEGLGLELPIDLVWRLPERRSATSSASEGAAGRASRAETGGTVGKEGERDTGRDGKGTGTGEGSGAEAVLTGEEGRGSLRFSRLLVGGLQVPAVSTGIRVRADSVRLEEGLAVPVFDGALGLEALELSDLLRSSRHLETGILLSNLSLAEMTRAYGLPALEGTMDGYFPRVRLSMEALAVDGGGEISLFGGRIRVSDISGQEVLSRYPKLAFAAEFHDIDLQRVTRTFDFGEMTGTLQGRVRRCELFRGVPVRLEAEIETVRRPHVSRTINVKAINNIAILGTGSGFNIFDRGIHKFFDTYTYDRLGIGMSLESDAFVLRGLVRDRGRELFLKGRLPFPINVVNAQPGTTVSFRTMMERVRSLDFSKVTTGR